MNSKRFLFFFISLALIFHSCNAQERVPEETVAIDEEANLDQDATIVEEDVEVEVEEEEEKIVIIEDIFEAEEPGSGDKEPLQECKLKYIIFEDSFLRGVKGGPGRASFNNSSWVDCKKKCCYESNFECKSFTFYAKLHMCYIMNRTKEDSDELDLIHFTGCTHGQVLPLNKEVTTMNPYAWETTYYDAIEVTPQAVTNYDLTSDASSGDGGSGATTSNKTFNKPGIKEEEKETGDVRNEEEGEDGSKIVKIGDTEIESNIRPAGTPEKLRGSPNPIDCNRRCINGGTCEVKIVRGFRMRDDVTKHMCNCPDGYSGKNCENKMVKEASLPTYVIILIVLGSIVVILFLAVFIMYQIWKRRRGEYRVKKQREKWRKNGTGPNSQDFVNADGETNSPTTSVQSIHGSVTSSATHSTTTSV